MRLLFFLVTTQVSLWQYSGTVPLQQHRGASPALLRDQSCNVLAPYRDLPCSVPDQAAPDPALSRLEAYLAARPHTVLVEPEGLSAPDHSVSFLASFWFSFRHQSGNFPPPVYSSDQKRCLTIGAKLGTVLLPRQRQYWLGTPNIASHVYSAR